MGRAAAAYGKFQAAREAFAAAGQWVELMPLCALQGDFASLRDYAARVSGTQVCLGLLACLRVCMCMCATCTESRHACACVLLA